MSRVGARRERDGTVPRVTAVPRLAKPARHAGYAPGAHRSIGGWRRSGEAASLRRAGQASPQRRRRGGPYLVCRAGFRRPRHAARAGHRAFHSRVRPLALLRRRPAGVLDHRLEGLERAIHDAFAVHEERGGTVDVGGPSGAHVSADGLLDVEGLKVLLPQLDVQADAPGILLQLVVRELAVVLEEDVVHLPELPLMAGGDRRLGGRDGVLVDGAEWELLE